MNADSLRALVSDYVVDNAAALDLDSSTLEVEYVLNWGGFVNYSYRVRDTGRAYHLKLSISAEDREALRRWFALEPLLKAYHAPPIVQWVELGPAAGLLLQHLPGRPPTLSAEVLTELVPVLSRLYRDRELAGALPPSRPITAQGAYLESFYRRAVEDLQGIRESRPSFVSADLVRWLESEVESLALSIASSAAFDEQLTKPVHADLWLDNVLWVNAQRWYLVDWDDLRIGDPAADVAALLGPTADDPRPLKMLEGVAGVLTSVERERLPHLGRATVLDWVIDPLSDWLDAASAPEHQELVRAQKERIHKRALACYRDLYS